MSKYLEHAIYKYSIDGGSFVEGRGIRIPVSEEESLEDIFTLLKFKLAN
ncbi:MAG: hypothetical protein QNK35_12600 [Bacteroides sp.]|nr:hypothetical protein [Bacteroides sp.]